MLRNVWNQVRTVLAKGDRGNALVEPEILTLSYDKYSWANYKTLKERGLPETEEVPGPTTL